MDLLITLLITFLAGVGLGVFVFASTVRKALAAARAELHSLRVEAEAKITEAENAIRQVKKVL